MALDPRRAAVDVLVQVLERGKSLTGALAKVSARCPPLQRPLLQEFCFGLLRSFGALDAIGRSLLHKPMKPKDRDLYYLIVLGIYQLRDMSIPAHAAVNETVAVTRALKKDWARGLVNGILRRYQREADEIEVQALTEPWRRVAYPRWLYDRIHADWPGRAESILVAGNARPPMSLRVNRSRTSRDDYLQQLADKEIPASALSCVDDGLVLDQPVNVEVLPGFSEGLVSVQDGAAQLAADFLDTKADMRVLDACAAPGGKTAHILERVPSAKVFALDIDEQRLNRVSENLARLGLEADICCADVLAPGDWWSGEPFDRILLDAPCSATGVIRRHPDIKWLRQSDDIAALAAIQAQMLSTLWPLLSPGGILLYATCSLLREENSMQIDQFLESGVDAEPVPILCDCGEPDGRGRQFFPGENDMDGFFYAALRKGEST